MNAVNFTHLRCVECSCDLEWGIKPHPHYFHQVTGLCEHDGRFYRAPEVELTEITKFPVIGDGPTGAY